MILFPLLAAMSAATAAAPACPATPDSAASLCRALAASDAQNDPDVVFEAGHVAEAEGDKANAREHWQRAVAADPASTSGQAAKQALAMLDVPLSVSTTPSAKAAQ